jgi:hypothetical protein
MPTHEPAPTGPKPSASPAPPPIVHRALTPDEIDSLREQWNKLHRGSSPHVVTLIYTEGNA